jgi:ferredoxin like protein
MLELGDVPERLARNRYITDEETSHIEVDQEALRASGAGMLLVRACAAHVYTMQPDGTVGVTYQACLECGTCLAIAPEGTLRWTYPRGGYGVSYREG